MHRYHHCLVIAVPSSRGSFCEVIIQRKKNIRILHISHSKKNQVVLLVLTSIILTQLARRSTRVTIVGFSLFIILVKSHGKATIFFTITNGMLSYRDENEARTLMSTIDNKDIDGVSPESRNCFCVYYGDNELIGESLRFSIRFAFAIPIIICVCRYRTVRHDGRLCFSELLNFVMSSLIIGVHAYMRVISFFWDDR
jgi:hypothetical protein